MSNRPEYQRSHANGPWDSPWPADGLEKVSACPACGRAERSPWHGALIDSTFQVAAGRWDLWQCAECGSGYLDPRPTPATIPGAYATYYTHTTTESVLSKAPRGLFERIRVEVASGYARWRYSARRDLASVFGALVASLLPLHRSIVDREYRHLPRPSSNANMLLDIGCGNGAFLALAQTCGWQGLGLEPDPAAARTACELGVEVITGGIEQLHERSECFDAITLSHVLEHMHSPAQVLEQCHRLLKPGGILWLETPNALSLGHTLFGRHWRGLEAPRHLVLFTERALRQVLARSGFANVRHLRSPSSRSSIFEQSWSSAHGDFAKAAPDLPPRLRRLARLGRLTEAIGLGKREFLTLSARKPK